MSRSNNKTSIIVQSQLPAFIREEHDTFIKFLEYYYKSQEEEGQTLYLSKNMLENLDIDNIYNHVLEDYPTEELRAAQDYHIFLQKMYDTFIKYIPDSILADKTTLLKHAKEFYLSAGSERSVRFLIQALFNKEASFYYPKTDILRASDGKWFIERSLKVTSVHVDNVANGIAVTNFANTTIKGATSNATAIVEKVDTYYDKGELIYELKLSNIYKEFLNNEKIFAYYTQEGVDRYITANLFSGVITFVRINNGGTGYTEGTTVPIVSNTGSGAQIVISKVSKGTIQAAGVVKSGAGFQVDNDLLIFGSGTGAAGVVSDVDDSGFYHPNSYNVVWSTIALEANTAIGNAVYSNLASAIVDPANAWITNSMSYFAYANCGPALSLAITAGGQDYVPPITIGISANSMITKMGILGKMQIVSGGLGYTAGDTIEFINPPGSTGSGAIANVTNVAANGMITEVRFEQMPGQIIGGSGYDWFNLPTANVVSATGDGTANIAVTAIIGQNEEIIQSVSNVGTIQEMTIVDGGSGYSDVVSELPYLALDTLGDGTANATLTVVTGVFSYPGRYITDDGHLSGYNFLEDRDYYQEFSYVVRVDESINRYRAALKDLTHPAGARLFGEYNFIFDNETQTNTNVTVTYANTESMTLPHKTMYQVQGYTSGVAAPNVITGVANAEFVVGAYSVNTTNHLSAYAASNNDITIAYNFHGFYANDRVFLHFQSNAWANLGNTNYIVTQANVSHFTVYNPLTETVSGNTGNVRVYNPDIEVTVPYSRPALNENVYIQFQSVDPSMANGFYQVLSVKNANTFNVLHPDMTTANAATGVANVITKKIVVTAENHELNVGDQTYLLLLGGDTANTDNGYYMVTGVGSANSFNVTAANTLFAGSVAEVHQKNSRIVIPSHPYANGNLVYVAFTSGDQANVTNGVYQPVKVGSDVFRINVAKPATGNSNVRVWYQTNNYSNIVFTTLKTDNGFTANDNVYIEFYASATDLANGIYMINREYSTNTYNVVYNGNTYIQNAYSTYASLVYIPGNTNNTINIVAHSGLGIVSGSVMEGMALVSPYK
jgi:hypothetical protein